MKIRCFLCHSPLFSVRYAAQLRQLLRFRTPLPTGIQDTKTHRQAQRWDRNLPAQGKRMRNGKGRLTGWHPVKGERKSRKNVAGEGQRKPLLTRLFSRRNRRGTSASMWDNTPPLRARKKAGGCECHPNKCGRLLTEKVGNRVTVFERIRRERKYPNGRNADGFQTVSLKGIYPGGWDSQKKESPLEFSGLPSRGGRANPRFPFHILLMYPILGYARGYRPYP